MLQVPRVGEIHSRDPSDFTIVVEFDAVVTDNLALERPDEDLILDMYVFVPHCISWPGAFRLLANSLLKAVRNSQIAPRNLSNSANTLVGLPARNGSSTVYRNRS